ncbi:MAG TPA: response regulator [Polyangiaceae bacterium]|jgi:DNA-binding response OmpR family regulator
MQTERTVSRLPSSLALVPPARVLLAEDDPELRQMVGSALRADGYDVIEVKDGGRLLVQIGTAYLDRDPTGAFDLLISDVRMPICNGVQILEGLRQARWDTPAIVMTAFGDDATRARIESLGAAYFDKPFDLDDLRTAVVYMLQRKRAPYRRAPHA